MVKKSFISRNVIAVAICLAGFSASNVLAQNFNATIGGIDYTFSPTTHPDGFDVVTIYRVNTLPTSVTKWVLPETVTNNSTTYRVRTMSNAAFNPIMDNGKVIDNNVEEIVFPKYMEWTDLAIRDYDFRELHKITFGEEWTKEVAAACAFNDHYNEKLDTIIFLGDKMRTYGSPTGAILTWWDNSFNACPSNTKIIVPCGKLADFVAAFNARPIPQWTAANFVEAECVSSLTVLSSNNNLGNAWSVNGSQIITSTPTNTTANFSGNATLIALAKANKVFIGWADGNLDNPRTVNVTEDVTYTAIFADCENSGIRSAKAASPLTVYPNPANNTLNVELENYVNNGTLTLFDMSGKIVLSRAINGNSAQINISQLTSGNYILHLVENGTASIGVQIIKN